MDDAGPRITFSLTESGVLELWLNNLGRELLIQKLQALDRSNDHFHFDPDGMIDLKVSTIPYRDTDRILDWGKVYLRPDEWDLQYYPHVLSGVEPTDP